MVSQPPFIFCFIAVADLKREPARSRRGYRIDVGARKWQETEPGTNHQLFSSLPSRIFPNHEMKQIKDWEYSGGLTTGLRNGTGVLTTLVFHSES